ncbi:MAG TPA: hypothetical protein VI793_14085 [Anaerolineales bacterium]|nr:hypothetical protein [Anaerolineales bacterium]
MNEQELAELLSVHADHLVNDVDLTDELPAVESEPEREVVKPLLRLARKVKAALFPVEPRRDFVAELKGELRANARQSYAAAARQEARQRKVIWVAAGLGGLVYFVGMALVSMRLSLAFLSFVAGLLGWRLVRQRIPKTRIAS